MKKIILLIVLSTITSAFAQESLTAKQMADYQDKLMIKQLDLNEDQQKSIKEINLKYSKKQQDLIKKEGSMFNKMGDMRKLQKEKNEELQAVLTEKQFKVYEDDIQPEIRKYMRKNIKF